MMDIDKLKKEMETFTYKQVDEKYADVESSYKELMENWENTNKYITTKESFRQYFRQYEDIFKQEYPKNILDEFLPKDRFLRNQYGNRMYSAKCVSCTEHLEEAFTCILCHTYCVSEVIHYSKYQGEWVDQNTHWCHEAPIFLETLLYAALV